MSYKFISFIWSEDWFYLRGEIAHRHGASVENWLKNRIGQFGAFERIDDGLGTFFLAVSGFIGKLRGNVLVTVRIQEVLIRIRVGGIELILLNVLQLATTVLAVGGRKGKRREREGEKERGGEREQVDQGHQT